MGAPRVTHVARRPGHAFSKTLQDEIDHVLFGMPAPPRAGGVPDEFVSV